MIKKSFISSTTRKSRKTLTNAQSLVDATFNQPAYDEAEFQEMVKRGTAAWADTPHATQWLEQLRQMDEQDCLLSTQLEQVRQDIRAGLDSGAATTWDPAQIKRDGRTRHRNKA